MYLIKCCPLQHTGFFVETFTRRVVYFVARCRLLSDGKCLRKHQITSENEYLLASDIGLNGSFESDEQNKECTVSLTMRSLSAMKYFNVFINQIVELEWNTKQLAVTDMINDAYVNFEADLYNVLYSKQGIQKNSLVLKLKHERRVVIRFTAQSIKEHSAILGTDLNVWKLGDDVKIFQNLQPAVLQNILKGLINSPAGLDGTVYNVVSALKQVAHDDDTEENSLLTTYKSIETVNKSLGIGSRALGSFQQSKKSNNISAVLTDNSQVCAVHTDKSIEESTSSNLTDNEETSNSFISSYSSAHVDDESDVNDPVGINLSKAKRKFLNNKGYFANDVDIFDEDSAWYTQNEFDTTVPEITQKRRLNSSSSVDVKTNDRSNKKPNYQEGLIKSVVRRSLKSKHYCFINVKFALIIKICSGY